MRYIVHETAEGRQVSVERDGTVLAGAPFSDDLSAFALSVQAAEAGRAVPGPVTPGLALCSGARMICLGLNYVEHAKEGGHSKPDYPAFFLRVDTSLAPSGTIVPVPRVSDRLDYEAELLVMIGRGGRYIPEDEALGHVFAYGVFNDISLRDYQRKGGQWTPGKNFDLTGILGAGFVTPDEVPAGASGLAIRSILNGQVMQEANTSDMIFPVARAISLISDFMTLRPGDMIAMGTPSGVGYARTPPVFMAEGDVISVEIEGIGVATATIGGRDA